MNTILSQITAKRRGPQGGTHYNYHLSPESHFRRYGRFPNIKGPERKQILLRIGRAPVISNSFELHRLRMKSDEICRQMETTKNGEHARLVALRLDCEKAIAALALL